MTWLRRWLERLFGTRAALPPAPLEIEIDLDERSLCEDVHRRTSGTRRKIEPATRRHVAVDELLVLRRDDATRRVSNEQYAALLEEAARRRAGGDE